MTGSVITVESVTKRYGEIVAVDELSLAILPGEVYSLVGRNGAGKSTLIRMMVGITEPDAGRVFICGEDLAHRLPATKRHLGYLPEELILYERLTGREYLELVAGLKESDPSQIPEEIEFFELAHAQEKLVGGYSLGMRKKLGLAAAMLGNAEVLILDEPLNGLDVEMMRKLRLRIESEKEEGRSFLISSHVMSFVERISDRVGIMRAGRLTAEGHPAELRITAGMPDALFEDVFFYLAG
ncbi:MAG TPA: ABC transporter ATP-binding protein [Blastocatellia bacterium]|nr:ABC transporter ATP-binding protein [Blastocatellia bacterium]